MTIEQLLNKLIEKGWKPFEDNDVIRVKCWYSVHFLCRPIVNFVLDWYAEATVPLKEILTSRSSWLWQFVCENRLWKDVDEEKYWHKKTPKISELRSYDYHFEEYRVIESSLKDESELEQFLLSNIKVEWK